MKLNKEVQSCFTCRTFLYLVSLNRALKAEGGHELMTRSEQYSYYRGAFADRAIFRVGSVSLDCIPPILVDLFF